MPLTIRKFWTYPGTDLVIHEEPDAYYLEWNEGYEDSIRLIDDNRFAYTIPVPRNDAKEYFEKMMAALLDFENWEERPSSDRVCTLSLDSSLYTEDGNEVKLFAVCLFCLGDNHHLRTRKIEICHGAEGRAAVVALLKECIDGK